MVYKLVTSYIHTATNYV